MNAAPIPAPLYPHLTLHDEAPLAPDRLAALAEAGVVLAERRRGGRRGPGAGLAGGRLEVRLAGAGQAGGGAHLDRKSVV